MFTTRNLILGALLVAMPLTADAQRRSTRRSFDRTSRGAVGASFNYGRPVGDFLNYVDQGFGFDLFGRMNLEPQGILSLRLNGGLLIYGHETVRVPLSSTIGGRILVDLTTSNNIVWAGIGPQITLPTQGIQPYGYGEIGFSYFFTESSVEGSNNNEAFASTTNYSDATFRYGFGGGFLIPIRTASTDWAIDLGATYHGNGLVRYLREGGITDLPDGTIVVTPIQSEANLLMYRLGFSISLR
jgi:hypothetical protein